MRVDVVAAAYALWILGTFVIFYAISKDENALEVAVMAGVIPACCQMLFLGIDWRGLVAPTKIWLALLLIVLLSYIVNAMDPQTAPGIGGQGLLIPAAWMPIVYTLNTVFVLGIATLIAGCPDRSLLQRIASFYCIFAIPFLIYVDLTGEMVWGRLTAGLEPNNWGLMALTVCVAAFARKLGPVAVAGFAVGVETILLASSREHLLALAVILAVAVVLYFRGMTRIRLGVVLAGSCATLVLFAVLLDPYITDAIRYVGHDILLVDSPDRGVDSGFTGRSAIWVETLNLWLKHPFIGIGFRQHEQFLEGAPAHSAYLAMLADTGLVGFIWYLILLIRSLVDSWHIEDQRTRRFVVVAIVGYIIAGFFDRRTINPGNPYGLLFLICCSVALVNQSLRKAEFYRKRQRLLPSAIGSTLAAGTRV
jgi:hypothetical protein